MSAAAPPQGDRPLGGTARSAVRGEHTSAAGPLRGRQPQPFCFQVRVYYEDTDAAGIVYYANYLKFMERARTEWLAALGLPLAAFERDHGVVFVVHRCEIDFRLPARLNDALDVTVETLRRGASFLVVQQDVLRAGDVLTSAQVKLACIDSSRWRPVRIPAELAGRMENV